MKITKLPTLKYGTIWEDPIKGHRIGCLDATNKKDVIKLMNGRKSVLAIQDPPYNLNLNKEFKELPIKEYISWSEKWVDNTIEILEENASLYVWLGGDIKNGLQPLVDFVLMMRNKPVKLKNFITLRKQRGYGTQKNWMSVRQELLYYVKNNPFFNVKAEYTNIPKILRGYYKTVGGKLTETMERSKSPYIRAGNVWVDIQQVFYLLEEHVEGCYTQKPLKAIARIIDASSNKNDPIVDFFAHSGSTLLQAEISNRKCYTMDISPIYCKITLARLLHYRNTGKTGWGRIKIIKNEEIAVNDEVLLRG
ncbi:site-specific DNA-methyltransferase [Candidatus Shapirobacteria bacterium CG09_land_8_20_14_0_10_39_12]|uniref:Site-specific DNA-methyltransferase n=1 Tax=Candidatus Shapirobacteria bacterium CG09_land_8_20_14_0_10_39_12 TaxID=1974885 RepID=A0A2H0WRB2_9BACT|nr:MAG: site-specific DNA-methyltransferase [Candidatus Shapirobacteria bacterium CG09_land_8_20_14_0_10_39_12]